MWLIVTELVNQNKIPKAINTDAIESCTPNGGPSNGCKLRTTSGDVIMIAESSTWWPVGKLNSGQPSTVDPGTTHDVASVGLEEEDVKNLIDEYVKNHLHTPNSKLVNTIKRLIQTALEAPHHIADKGNVMTSAAINQG